MKRSDASILAGLTTLVVAAILYAALVATAGGQERPDPVVMLARTCVSERGWRIDTNDCSAIGEVVAERVARVYAHLSQRDAWVAALRDLSPRLHGDAPIAREWIRELGPASRRPPSWPGGRWTRPAWCGPDDDERPCDVARRDDWTATLAEAQDVYAGTSHGPDGSPGPVCVRPPVAWGSEADVRARERLGRARWVEVDCGATVNRYGGWVLR